jgi:hypothetical protein
VNRNRDRGRVGELKARPEVKMDPIDTRLLVEIGPSSLDATAPSRGAPAG